MRALCAFTLFGLIGRARASIPTLEITEYFAPLSPKQESADRDQCSSAEYR